MTSKKHAEVTIITQTYRADGRVGTQTTAKGTFTYDYQSNGTRGVDGAMSSPRSPPGGQDDRDYYLGFVLQRHDEAGGRTTTYFWDAANNLVPPNGLHGPHY